MFGECPAIEVLESPHPEATRKTLFRSSLLCVFRKRPDSDGHTRRLAFERGHQEVLRCVER